MGTTNLGSKSIKMPDEDGKTSSSMSFDDALTAAGFGIFNFILIINCGFIFSAILLETLILSFVLPVAQCDLNLTTSNKGILSGAAFVGLILSTHLWGFLADIFGRRKIIWRTLFISFVCTLLSSMATNFWFLLVFRFLCGFFISGAGAVVYPYLSEFHNLKNRSRAILGASIVFGGGCMALPGLAWLVLSFEYEFIIPIIGIVFKPWRLLIIVGGMLSFVSGFVTLWYPESPKFLLLDKKEKEAINVITQMFKWNGGSKKGVLEITSLIDETSVSTTSHSGYNIKSPLSLLYVMWEQTAPLFSQKYIRATLIAMTMQFGVYTMSNGFYMWLPDVLNRYAEYRNQFPNAQATICEILKATGFGLETVVDTNSTTVECFHQIDNSTFQLSFLLEIYFAVGYIVLSFIVRPVGILPLIIIITTITGACSFTLLFITEPLISIHVLLIIIVSGLAITLINAATVEIYPTELRATGFCVVLLVGRIGCIFGSNLSGYLLQYSCQSLFVFAGVELIFCGFIGVFLPHIYKIVDKKIVFL